MFFRNKNIILFYACQDNFLGNSKYAYLAIKNKFPKKRLVWLTDTYKQAKEIYLTYNIECYQKKSMQANWLRLRTGYSVSDGGFFIGRLGLFHRAIDFWHGFPFKKIGAFDAGSYKISLYKSLCKIITFVIKKKYVVHVTHSQYALQVILNAYRLPLDIGKVMGAPRLEPMMLKSADLYKQIEKEGKELKMIRDDIVNYKKVYLYAPTFRDNQENFLDNLNLNLGNLNDALVRQGAVFVFKMHPLSTMQVDKNKYSNIRVIRNDIDIYVIIALSHVVITDYSSIFVDVMWHKDKQVVLLHGDIDSYKKNCRDMYEEPLSDMDYALKLKGFPELIKFINGSIPYHAVPQKIVDKYWDKSVLENIHGYLDLIE